MPFLVLEPIKVNPTFRSGDVPDTRPLGETNAFAPIFFQATGYQSDKEWRLVRPIDPGCEPEQMQVRFPVASVRRVVMGPAWKNAQDKIQQLMKNDPS